MKYGTLSYLMTREEVRQALLPVMRPALENEFLLIKMGHGVMSELRVGKQFGMADPILLRAYAAIADWLLRERGLVAVANTVQELVQAISFSRDGKVAVKVLPREGLGEQWVARAFPTFTGPSSLRYGPQIAGETSWLRRVRDAEEARVAEKGKG